MMLDNPPHLNLEKAAGQLVLSTQGIIPEKTQTGCEIAWKVLFTLSIPSSSNVGKSNLTKIKKLNAQRGACLFSTHMSETRHVTFFCAAQVRSWQSRLSQLLQRVKPNQLRPAPFNRDYMLMKLNYFATLSLSSLKQLQKICQVTNPKNIW